MTENPGGLQGVKNFELQKREKGGKVWKVAEKGTKLNFWRSPFKEI